MTGLTALIIPVRSLDGGKSRLAGVLQPAERKELNRTMMEGVVRAAIGLDITKSILVISPDRETLSTAKELDPCVTALMQNPEFPGLNAALRQSTRYAIEHRASAVAILPADLPLVETRDIEHLLRRDAAIVIAPDRHQQGTNGLLQRLDATRGAFEYQFGLGSYQQHREEAHRLGFDPAISISLGTSFDLDTPTDLEALDRFPRSIRPSPQVVTHGD